jgi:uncharacterized BrkB/YihY/UPF0761 family membrane protein
MPEWQRPIPCPDNTCAQVSNYLGLTGAILFIAAAALFAASAGYFFTRRSLTRLYEPGWRDDRRARLRSLQRLMIVTLIAVLVTLPLGLGGLVLTGAPGLVVLLGLAVFVYCVVSAAVAILLTNRTIKTLK